MAESHKHVLQINFNCYKALYHTISTLYTRALLFDGRLEFFLNST